jgi:large-conductance mechanosensitive channel
MSSLDPSDYLLISNTNTPESQSQSQNQNPTPNKQPTTTDASGNSNSKPKSNSNSTTIPKITYIKSMVDFLNSKSGTIISSAAGLAIGVAFKDVIDSLVNDLLKPIINMIITKIKPDYVNNKNIIIQYSKAISAFFTFIIVTIVVMGVVTVLNSQA